MTILGELKRRFRAALTHIVDDADECLEMIRPAQDARFGDYQANCAMPLGKRLGQPSRDVAQRIVERLDLGDMCQAPEIAGPGFINLRLSDAWIASRLEAAGGDERLGVGTVSRPRTFVIDYSSPNVAKPMHVGHIRSTVIGDALRRTLAFRGHQVISDNHLGDWGTQFGMIIYGFKHFVDRRRYDAGAVQELSRLYKRVSRLIAYHAAVRRLPEAQAERDRLAAERAARRAAPLPAEKAEAKLEKEARRAIDARWEAIDEECQGLAGTVAAVESDGELAAAAAAHPQIESAVLDETAKLHAGNPENVALWHEFLPACRQEIQKIYARLGIRFDHELGESFYHDRLGAVVADLAERKLATTSEGAVCVFLDGFDSPMIVRKKDGAYLYATSDLATIQYRMETWNPDAILYVVDHRQSEHFDKLFAAARRWGYDRAELVHVSFGTVLGEDGRPYKTRAGDVVDLEALLDEAIERAYLVVAANDDAKKTGAELSEDERRKIARVVGHAAVKYADLSHNRTSDYVFSFDKMVALEGNTATYMQYAYARTQSIFAKGAIDASAIRLARDVFRLDHPAERDLAIELLRFEDAIDESLADYRPNQLTAYLYKLASKFATFYHAAQVLSAETDALRSSRLALCHLAGRTLRQGLELLGIDVVDRM